jgi:hypothetical protein
MMGLGSAGYRGEPWQVSLVQLHFIRYVDTCDIPRRIADDRTLPYLAVSGIHLHPKYVMLISTSIHVSPLYHGNLQNAPQCASG